MVLLHGLPSTAELDLLLGLWVTRKICKFKCKITLTPNSQRIGAGDPCLVLTSDPKPRLHWTADVDERFVDAVAQLGCIGVGNRCHTLSIVLLGTGQSRRGERELRWYCWVLLFFLIFKNVICNYLIEFYLFIYFYLGWIQVRHFQLFRIV